MHLKQIHPLSLFFYFLSVIAFSMLIMHPVFQAISYLLGAGTLIMLGGQTQRRGTLRISFVMIFMSALFNFAVNHRGDTVLFQLFGSISFTAESFFYGVCAAVMFASGCFWFMIATKCLKNEHLSHLFGAIAKKTGIFFVMSLRFVPSVGEKMRDVMRIIQQIEGDGANKSITTKWKQAIRALSISVSWALQSGITTAEAMKSRGFGLKSKRRNLGMSFGFYDLVSILYTLFFSGALILLLRRGAARANFFPVITIIYTVETALAAVIFALLAAMPLVFEAIWQIKWHRHQKKKEGMERANNFKA